MKTIKLGDKSCIFHAFSNGLKLNLYWYFKKIVAGYTLYLTEKNILDTIKYLEY